VGRIGLVEMAGAGEPAQHASAHLLLQRRDIGRGERLGLGKADLPVFAHGKHPVDHAAVEVHMRIQCGAEALHKSARRTVLNDENAEADPCYQRRYAQIPVKVAAN